MFPILLRHFNRRSQRGRVFRTDVGKSPSSVGHGEVVELPSRTETSSCITKFYARSLCSRLQPTAEFFSGRAADKLCCSRPYATIRNRKRSR